MTNDEATTHSVMKLTIKSRMRDIKANEALKKMAENARELGLDYEPDWKDRLIAQHEETLLWQAKRIAELLDAPQPPAPLAKPHEQEPVAWMVEFENGEQELHFEEQSVGETQTPLYLPAQPIIKSYLEKDNSAQSLVVPDFLTAHDPETSEYRNGWNDCRQLMMEMYRRESK